MPKIFLYCIPAPEWDGVVGYAVAEDGTGLAGHVSTNEGYSKHDMGLTSNWKHETYQKHYPEGFDLEWIDDPNNHDGLKTALALNKRKQDPNFYSR